ncbi:MAG: AEC family transporter [Ignavibacteriaceae bacterium]
MNLQVFETVFAFIIVILLCLLLRKLSIIKEEDGKVFSNLLTKAVLPAVIFLQLSATPIKSNQFLLVFAVFVAGVLSMLLAWGLGSLLKLSRARTGALMLTSSFGSSALIGYPFIAYSFQNNPEAMADAVLLSELGVGLPMFILGPAIAMFFGDKFRQSGMKKTLSWSYFWSPIFISIVLGIVFSFIPFDRDHSYIEPFFEALKMINGALTVLACLILSLQLKFIPLKGIIPLFIISALIQMGFQPWIAHVQATIYNLSSLQTQVLVLVCSLPSAVLGPVFAKQYDCAPDTASALVMAHIVLSIVMVPAVYYLMI